jgi:hypothetical protein
MTLEERSGMAYYDGSSSIGRVGSIEPITISGFYDDGAPSGPPQVSWSVSTSANTNLGGTMTIGGDTCHLCGEESVFKNTYGKRRKDGSWKMTTVVEYACGTRVETSPKGQNSVFVGEDCIQLG